MSYCPKLRSACNDNNILATRMECMLHGGMLDRIETSKEICESAKPQHMYIYIYRDPILKDTRYST